MPDEKITSLQNPRLKQLVKLRDRRPRDEAGVFLVEGYREIRRALEKDVPLNELYYSPEWFLGENEPDLIERARAAGTQLCELGKDTFAKVAYRDRPDGLLAVAPQWRRALADLEAGPAPPFLLIVEAIEKPGNLGTILRSADAAGCDAVIVCDPVTDLFNPNVVRASTGVLFSLPCVVEGNAAVLAWLRARRRADRGHDPGGRDALHRGGPAGAAGARHGQRTVRLERILAGKRRPGGADPDGRAGRFAQCRDGDDDHAL